MRAYLKKASIAKLFAIYAGIMVIPLLLLVTNLVISVDYQLDQIAKNPETYDFITSISNDPSSNIKQIGSLRYLGGAIEHENTDVNFFLNLKFTILFTACMLIIIGIFTLYWVYEPIITQFSHISESIDDMLTNDLTQTVSIKGSKNIKGIYNRLERLRSRMGSEGKRHQLFFRSISHELKTPLTSIKEGNQLLADEALGKLNKEQLEVTTILKKSTNELQASIEKLLNYNSSSAFDKIKQREVANLSDLMKKTISRQAIALKARRLKIHLTTKPTHAFVNKEQISTIFENLLSNAIKFSPKEGTITIQVMRINNTIECLVQDQGPGVDCDKSDAIFSAFYVGQETTASSIASTGLGLSIARKYAELHEGTLKLTCPVENSSGACFRLALTDR